MTNQAMRTLFWGYLFIFFRVQIGIDWLADPLGYLMIATACTKLSNAYPPAKKRGFGLRSGFSFPCQGYSSTCRSSYSDGGDCMRTCCSS